MKALIVSAAVTMFAATAASAATLMPFTSISADSVAINLGSSADNAINQSGLMPGYSAGDDFDAYVAGALHSFETDTEYFSAVNAGTAVLTLGFGSVIELEKLGVFNENAQGAGSVAFEVSTDGITYTSIGTLFTTPGSPRTDYAADVFSFGPVMAQFVRATLSDCGNYCAVGEIIAGVTPIPLPATLPLLLGAGAGLFALRRRQTAAVAA
ncbi:MAG: hypothetical protein NXI12_14965 [Alphaproteobacteria bacterium]|nr:hypothetical protein [Alphaproteobacteria bacterium]